MFLTPEFWHQFHIKQKTQPKPICSQKMQKNIYFFRDKIQRSREKDKNPNPEKKLHL